MPTVPEGNAEGNPTILSEATVPLRSMGDDIAEPTRDSDIKREMAGIVTSLLGRNFDGKSSRAV